MEVLTVSELTSAIKQKLESNFFFVSVRGEVSNLRTQASGHTYFTLKDQGAQISAVLFRGNSAGMRRIPKEGDEVIVKGQLSVYAPRGHYQVIVREVEFSGVGELLKLLHKRKEELEAAGWFAPEKKKALPRVPKRIGVVTSPTGSVIQDIIHVLSRRFPGFELLLNPVKVQGEGAAEEIASAINQMNRHKLCDVLIVGRGGGSIEDLWPFNEIVVAEAIHNSSIPVVSAVGHETDFTIADFVADVRAPTPSAAAEVCVIDKAAELEKLSRWHARLFAFPKTLLSPFWQKLDLIEEGLHGAIEGKLGRSRLLLEGMKKQVMQMQPSQKIRTLKKGFSKKEEELLSGIKRLIVKKKERLKGTAEHLASIDPTHLLKKGYSIAFSENSDSVILSTKDVLRGERIRIRLSDGQILAEVKE